MKYSIPHAQKVLQVVLVHVFPLKTRHKDEKDCGLFTVVELVTEFHSIPGIYNVWFIIKFSTSDNAILHVAF